MDDRTVLFDAIREAYGFDRDVETHRVSERVWRFRCRDSDVAVKLYATEHDARAQKEAAVLAHLQAHGDTRFRTQRLRCTVDGRSTWTGHDTHALMTRWITGQSRTYDTFSPAEWSALGASLAALHLSLDRLTLTALDTLGARLAAIDADAARRSLAVIGRDAAPQGDATGLRAYVDTCLRMIDAHYPGSIEAFPADDPQRPVHNDYNQFNYLFDGVLPPVILDWEAMIGAPREYEVVRCLNHLPLEAPALAASFLRGYLQVRPLSAACIPWAVDAASLQHALKRWIWDGWRQDPARFEPHLRGAMKIVATMAGARDRLIAFFCRCVDAAHGQGT